MEADLKTFVMERARGLGVTSQSALGEKLGVSQQQVSFYLCGQTPIPQDKAAILIALLSLTDEEELHLGRLLRAAAIAEAGRRANASAA